MVQVVKVWPLSPSKIVVVFSTLTLADTQKSGCQFMVYLVYFVANALVEHPVEACGPNQVSRSINVYCLFSITKASAFSVGHSGSKEPQTIPDWAGFQPPPRQEKKTPAPTPNGKVAAAFYQLGDWICFSRRPIFVVFFDVFFVMSKEIHQITVACCSHEPPNRQIITNRCIYIYTYYVCV